MAPARVAHRPRGPRSRGRFGRLSEKAFQKLVGRLDPPVYVVTTVARDDGERSGCLVGFATQCSIHPPRFVTCISKVNHTFGVVTRAGSVVVHFLGSGQRDLAALFGHETGDEVDKFAECEWSEGPDGIPLLAGVPGWFAGRILDRFDLGDHVGLWLEPFAAEDAGGLVDLGFQAVKPVEPGHPA